MTVQLRMGWTGDCPAREGSPNFQLDCKGTGFQREEKNEIFPFHGRCTFVNHSGWKRAGMHGVVSVFQITTWISYSRTDCKK